MPGLWQRESKQCVDTKHWQELRPLSSMTESHRSSVRAASNWPTPRMTAEILRGLMLHDTDLITTPQWVDINVRFIKLLIELTRHCTTLCVVGVNLCRWCDHTSQVEIDIYWPTHCAVTPLVYSWNQVLPGRRCLHLERFAGGCDLRSITAGVQTTPEDSSVQPQLSEHMCYLNFVFLLWQWS